MLCLGMRQIYCAWVRGKHACVCAWVRGKHAQSYMYLSALSGRLLLAAERSDPSVLGPATDCEGSSTGTLKIKGGTIMNTHREKVRVEGIQTK